jgi:hypothetical protein
VGVERGKGRIGLTRPSSASRIVLGLALLLRVAWAPGASADATTAGIHPNQSATKVPGTGLHYRSTGLISGTPRVPGTYAFSVEVTDSTTSAPQTATQTLSITVAP